MKEKSLILQISELENSLWMLEYRAKNAADMGFPMLAESLKKDILKERSNLKYLNRRLHYEKQREINCGYS